MKQKVQTGSKKTIVLSPVKIRQQKRSDLRKAYGMWRNRKPDPIKELEKMRREWQ